MAINVAFFLLPGTPYAVLPEDISFGSNGNLQFSTNNDGLVQDTEIVKESATITVKGVSSEVLTALRATRANNIVGRINGSVSPVDMDIMGYILEKALLNKVTPKKIVKIEGVSICDIEVEYQSLVYV